MVATAKGADLAALGINDAQAAAWYSGMVLPARKAGTISWAKKRACRVVAARRWSDEFTDEDGERNTYGAAVIELCEEVADANDVSVEVKAVLAKAKAERDWQAFFEALLPFIIKILEMILPLFLAI